MEYIKKKHIYNIDIIYIYIYVNRSIYEYKNKIYVSLDSSK